MTKVFFIAVNDVTESSKYYSSIVKGIEHKGALTKLWGITELSSNTFKRIEKDDIILFYNKKKIIGKGLISSTFIDEKLSELLWGSYIHKLSGKKLLWLNIIELAEFYIVDIKFDDIIKMGGYNEKFSIRRLIELNPTGMEFISSNFPSVINWYDNL